MISLTSIPERIINGESLTVKLEIKGQINIKMYKGTYFNLVIKKNGGTLGSTSLYPLRYNGFELKWDVNPNSYGSDGTFNVLLVYQNYSSTLNPNGIAGTTFIVEPNCIINKVNTCNNITYIEQTKRFKDSQIKKEEIPIDYTGGCQIEKPNTIVKFMPKINVPIENELNSFLLSNAKVQKASRNV